MSDLLLLGGGRGSVSSGIVAPYFIAAYDFAPSNSVIRYGGVSMGSHLEANSWSSTGVTAKHPMPCAGTAKNLHVRLITPLAAGTSWQFSMMKNESAQSLSVTYTNGVDLGTDKADTANSVSFSAGDFIGLQSNPTGTPTANAKLNMSFSIESALNEQPIFFAFANVAAGATVYAGGRSSTTEAQVSVVMPTAGTISNLYAYASTAPGAGQTYTATIFKNGSADATLEAQITNSSSGRLESDTVGTVSVVAGDLISVRIVGSAGAATADVFCSVKFAPTVSGEAVVFTNMYDASFTVDGFTAAGSDGSLASGSGNDVNPDMPITASVSKLAIKPSAAPDTGKSWTATLRKNAADSALTVNVVNLETYDINTSSISFTQGDSIGLKSTPTGNPFGSTRPVRVGFVVTP